MLDECMMNVYVQSYQPISTLCRLHTPLNWVVLALDNGLSFFRRQTII